MGKHIGAGCESLSAPNEANGGLGKLIGSADWPLSVPNEANGTLGKRISTSIGARRRQTKPMAPWVDDKRPCGKS